MRSPMEFRKASQSNLQQVAGKTSRLLLQAVRRVDKDLSMPPDDPLPAKDVETLTAWVKMGAPWPAGEPAPTGIAANDPRNHWAFKPVHKPPVPGWGNGVMESWSNAK